MGVWDDPWDDRPEVREEGRFGVKGGSVDLGTLVWGLGIGDWGYS